MEELRKFQSSTFDTIARRKLIEDQNTILELSGKVQELQKGVNCMNDSKDFQNAESVRCSKIPTEAMQWIKEVELVDSVDELRSSLSIRCISMPNFEVLDARIASALNKIIHNSLFKWRISLEEQKSQKQDSFLRGKQIAHLVSDYFRVTGSCESVENYADLFTISPQMMVFKNSILSGSEFCCQ